MKLLLFLAIVLMALPAMADTDDDKNPGYGYLPQTTVQQVDPPAMKSQATSSSSDNLRLTSIERRLAAVEAKAISAEEAREIAEDVVDKRINELRLAISTPNGGQRVETVNFKTYSDNSQIKLNPGERLMSYTDASGRTVNVSQPGCQCGPNCQCGQRAAYVSPPPRQVQYASQPVYQQPVQWATNDVSFSMSSQPVNMTRTVNIQPVRRGFFGRTVAGRPRTYSQSLMSGQNCQMVNVGGRMMKVCN